MYIYIYQYMNGYVRNAAKLFSLGQPAISRKGTSTDAPPDGWWLVPGVR
jgi:hypothetical protein